MNDIHFGDDVPLVLVRVTRTAIVPRSCAQEAMSALIDDIMLDYGRLGFEHNFEVEPTEASWDDVSLWACPSVILEVP